MAIPANAAHIRWAQYSDRRKKEHYLSANKWLIFVKAYRFLRFIEWLEVAKIIACKSNKLHSPKMIFDTLMYTFIRFTNACLSSIWTYWIFSINLYPTICFIHSHFLFAKMRKTSIYTSGVDDKLEIGECLNWNQIRFITRVACDFELIIHILIACLKSSTIQELSLKPSHKMKGLKSEF